MEVPKHVSLNDIKRYNINLCARENWSVDPSFNGKFMVSEEVDKYVFDLCNEQIDALTKKNQKIKELEQKIECRDILLSQSNERLKHANIVADKMAACNIKLIEKNKNLSNVSNALNESLFHESNIKIRNLNNAIVSKDIKVNELSKMIDTLQKELAAQYYHGETILNQNRRIVELESRIVELEREAASSSHKNDKISRQQNHIRDLESHVARRNEEIFQLKENIRHLGRIIDQKNVEAKNSNASVINDSLHDFVLRIKALEDLHPSKPRWSKSNG